MPPAEKKESAPSPTASPAPSLSTSYPAMDNTVIIFDWDDTLLASSFLSGKGYRLETTLERTPEIDTQLKDLETSVVAVLKLASSFGHVHIVTNAETGWVQLSAQKFIPAVVPLLDKVKVVSARSTYESSFPDCPLKWKFYAFQEKLSKTFAPDLKSEKNVISFGDSHVEREAVRAVTKGFSNTRTKSVKFAERPSMEQLRRQIELVTNCFHYIIQHDGDLDLQLTVTVNTTNSGNNNNANTNNNTNATNNSNNTTNTNTTVTTPTATATTNVTNNTVNTTNNTQSTGSSSNSNNMVTTADDTITSTSAANQTTASASTCRSEARNEQMRNERDEQVAPSAMES
jgi:hypothetical protein